jgi:LysM repeat protein
MAEHQGFLGVPLRRRDRDDPERLAAESERRARRRRRRGTWLERNALGVAALSVLAGVLGVAFGLVQLLSRPNTDRATSQTAAPSEIAGQRGPAPTGVPVNATEAPASAGAAVGETTREIQASVRVLEPNYTVQPGDTLGRIASRYNTTVNRIQALNNLSSANSLTVGQKLVIPPPP